MFRPSYLVIPLILFFFSPLSVSANGDLPLLEQGKVIEKEIKGGEKDSYGIEIKSGQFLHLSVEQKGVLLRVTIYSPNDKKVVDLLHWKCFIGNISGYLIATETGQYRVEIKPGDNAVKGNYYVSVAELRQATPEDNKKIAAQLVHFEAYELYEKGDKESKMKSIDKLMEAVQLYRELKNPYGEAYALFLIAAIYKQLSDNKRSLEYNNQVLALQREIGDRYNAARTLLNISQTYDVLSDKEKALSYAEQALPIFKEFKDGTVVAIVLNQIGSIYDTTGEPKKALAAFEDALKALKESPDKKTECTIIANIGSVYRNLGEYKRALEFYLQALPLANELNSPQLQQGLMINIGSAYRNLSELQKALEYFNQALVLTRKTGNRQFEAVTLTNVALTYRSFGEIEKAIDYYSQSLAIARQIGNKSGVATNLGNIAQAYIGLGEVSKAIEYMNQVVPLHKETGEKGGEATAYHLLGTLYQQLGENQRALDYYNQALLIRRTIGTRLGEAQTLNSIGILYASLGEYQKALNLYNQSLPIAKSLSNRDLEAALLNSLGVTYLELGEYEKALESHNQCLSLNKQIEGRMGQAASLNNIGSVYLQMKNYQQALDYFNQALPLRKQVLDKLGESVTLDNIGRVYDRLGEKERALDFYNQSLALSRAVGDRAREAVILSNLARIKKSVGDSKGALADIENGIKQTEFIRSNVVSDDLRISFLAQTRSYYEQYVDILMSIHNTDPTGGVSEKALQISELARARSLLELITEAKADIRQGNSAELAQAERSLQQRLNDRASQLIQLKNNNRSKPEQINVAEKEINQLIAELQQLRTQIRQQNPKYANLTQPQPVTTQQIQQQLLDKETMLLEYLLGEERSFLWTVTIDSVKVYQLPPRAQIEASARNLYSLLSREQTKDWTEETETKYRQAAAELSQLLISPVADRLKAKRLLIVSDGPLQYIPFAALPNSAGGKLLIEDYEIVNLPSASVLAAIRQEKTNSKSADKLLAILADPVFDQQDPRVKQLAAKPDNKNSGESISQMALLRSAEETRAKLFGRLLFTRKEAMEIASLVPQPEQRLALDFDANIEMALSEELNQYRYIHFATHGFLNGNSPELSGIVLSLVDKEGKPQNGFLKLNEIYNMKLSADLVVLSACQTGLGKEIKGEGLLGLTRGFMYAGALRVVASLWKVDDIATSELMKLFYRGMLGEKKLSPSAALREAQLTIIKNGQFRLPYYWAAFTIQGEYK